MKKTRTLIGAILAITVVLGALYFVYPAYAASTGSSKQNYLNCPYFVDADGDGVCDNCLGSQLRLRNQTMNQSGAMLGNCNGTCLNQQSSYSAGSQAQCGQFQTQQRNMIRQQNCQNQP